MYPTIIQNLYLGLHLQLSSKQLHSYQAAKRLQTAS